MPHCQLVKQNNICKKIYGILDTKLHLHVTTIFVNEYDCQSLIFMPAFPLGKVTGPTAFGGLKIHQSTAISDSSVGSRDRLESDHTT